MRNQPTEAEDLLWRHLRARRCGGAKFSRQIPVGSYVVDFLSRERGLVVEVDGASHELTVDYDARRTAYLEQLGLRAVRFTNDEVMRNLDGVVRAIEMALRNPTPVRGADLPLPPAGGASDQQLSDVPPAGGRDSSRSEQGGVTP
jgi:very-short-patch-repair endonuclease